MTVIVDRDCAACHAVITTETMIADVPYAAHHVTVIELERLSSPHRALQSVSLLLWCPWFYRSFIVLPSQRHTFLLSARWPKRTVKVQS